MNVVDLNIGQIDEGGDGVLHGRSIEDDNLLRESTSNEQYVRYLVSINEPDITCIREVHIRNNTGLFRSVLDDGNSADVFIDIGLDLDILWRRMEETDD